METGIPTSLKRKVFCRFESYLGHKINALVVKLVDTPDLKSGEHRARAGSNPVEGTKKIVI